MPGFKAATPLTGPKVEKATRFADARASGNLWGIFPGFTAKVRRQLRQRLAGLAI